MYFLRLSPAHKTSLPSIRIPILNSAQRQISIRLGRSQDNNLTNTGLTPTPTTTSTAPYSNNKINPFVWGVADT